MKLGRIASGVALACLLAFGILTARASFDPPFNDIAAILVTASNQSTNSATVTSVTFGASDTTKLLQGLTHSTSSHTDRVVIVYPGKYLVCGFVSFASNATGPRRVIVTQQDLNNNVIDSGQIERMAVTEADVSYLTVSQSFNCRIGDYITLSAYQASGGNLNLLSANGVSLSVIAEPGQ